MRILITGGAGFIGSHMVRYLLAHDQDAEIINLDKLTYAGNLENLRDVETNPRYQFIHGDIGDEMIVRDIFQRGIDVVLNYAAETHVDRSIMDPGAFLRTDVIGTYTLLETARTYSIKKFIQISTDEVYGSIDEGETDEQAPFEPNSPYSASKAGADHLCRSYFHTYGLPVIVTHSCNFFGPNQYPEKLLPLAITNLLEGKKVPIYGNGMQQREWIFTDDHCRAIETIMTKGGIGEVYNIGSGERRTNLEMIRTILALMNLDESSIAYITDRPGHDRRYALNAARLRRFGWAPQVTIEEGLRRIILWYTQNRPWWERIKSGAYKEYYQKQYQSNISHAGQ